MTKMIARLTSAILVLPLVLPTVGCRQKEPEHKNHNAVDVQIDAGKTKVKIKGSTKPDEKARHVDVDVERHPGQNPKPADKAR